MKTLVGVVCEAAADQQTGCGLADRVLVERLADISAGLVAELRTWIGAAEPATEFLLWTQVSDLAKRKGIKAHGHFDGAPGIMDAHPARLALRLFHSLDRRPHAVIFLRDEDGQDKRLNGLEQARNESKNPFPDNVLIGFAQRMRESWVLAGFAPNNDPERKLIAELCDGNRGLGFNPTHEPERLRSSSEAELRCPKFVLRRLTNGDKQREESCWAETSLAVLCEHGKHCGLTKYLKEVEEILVPLVQQHNR